MFSDIINYFETIPKDKYIHLSSFFSFSSKKRLKVASFGQNSIYKGKIASIHAEINALNKINYKDSKKIIPYNLISLRFSKTNQLGNSRPCYHCLIKLKKSKINIKYVYYSDNDGNIIMEKFNDMIETLNFSIISSGYRYKN